MIIFTACGEFYQSSHYLIEERDSSVNDSVTQKNLGFKDHIYNMICVALFARVIANCTLERKGCIASLAICNK